MIDSSIHLKLECDGKAYVVCLMSLVKRAASLFFGFFFLFTTSSLMSLVDVYIMCVFFSFFLITFSILFITLSRRVGALQISIIFSPLQEIWTVRVEIFPRNFQQFLFTGSY